MSTNTVPQLKQQLKGSKTEITRLSDSLMRHHGQVEASKAEIMTLRGRLQMATKRADDAEKSLMAAQAAPRSAGRA
jgi:predicted  nucleic acid-binding Zn-ribbon protein